VIYGVWNQGIRKQVEACKAIFTANRLDELDNAGPQGCPTAGQLKWKCLNKVMRFLRDHDAGVDSESVWLEVGSGPMRPGVVALQHGAYAAIGVEVVVHRVLLAVLGAIGIAKHTKTQQERIGTMGLSIQRICDFCQSYSFLFSLSSSVPLHFIDDGQDLTAPLLAWRVGRSMVLV